MAGIQKYIHSMLIAGFILATSLMHAQQYSYRHYGVDDGLSSSEVYQVFQDSKGYVWFATDMGVSMFNGSRFQNFDISDGLQSNTVFEIFEDRHEKIWFLSMGNKLSYYYNDTIIQYNNPAIKTFIKNSKLPTKRSLFIDSLDNIYFSVMNKGIFKFTEKNRSLNYMEDDKSSSLRIIELPNKLLIGHNTINRLAQRIIYKDDTISTLKKDNKAYPMNATTLSFVEYGTDSNVLFLSVFRNIYQLKGNQLKGIKHFEDDILWFSKDKKGSYWLSERNKGIFCYSKAEFGQKADKSFLPEKSVSSILIDKDGGYWFSTLSKGVYYLPDYRIKTIRETENRNILDVCQNKNELLISTHLGELLIFDSQLKLNKRIDLGSKMIPYKILFDNRLKQFWLGTNSYVKILKNKTLIDTKYKNSGEFNRGYGTNYVKSMALSPKRGVWLGTSSGIFFLDNNHLQYYSNEKDKWKEIVYDIVCSPDESLWLATFSGLWKYTNGEYIYLGNQNPLFKHRINTLLKHGNKLYLGTKGAGLLIYSYLDKTVKQIQKSNGLSSNSISDIVIHKNNLWLSTNKGVSIIRNIDNENYSISKIKKTNGLLSDEIKQLYLHDSILYISSKKGVNYLNIDEYSLNNNLTVTNIEKISIANNDTLVNNSYMLDFKQNSISISYKAINYKTNNILYRYKMLPISDSWTYTTNEAIQFTTLAPGTYQFSVQAQNQSGQWNTQSTKIQFIINEAFWRTWWFMALNALLITALIIFLIQNKLRQITEQNRLKKELNLYMKKAINAQINPHFLFNSLNSINQYILKNDKINSSRYLNRFSKYMRSVLNALENDMQSLSEELKVSALYLELEKLRLKEKLSYDLKIDKSVVSRNALVPSMIIAPFLENAIWYGILPKKGNGLIKLSVSQKGNKITISIKDNGIGREEHLKLQKNPEFKLSNPGPENTLERIKLLNNLYPDIIKIVYTDIDEGTDKKGTIVDIIMNVTGSLNKTIQ